MVSGRPVYDALMNAKAQLSYGGQLTREYDNMPTFRRWVRILDAAGRAHQEPDGEVDERTRQLASGGECCSNDAHIVALAQIGGARLLCTGDRQLHVDFRNPTLVSRPRGNIYQRAEHQPLISQHCT